MAPASARAAHVAAAADGAPSVTLAETDNRDIGTVLLYANGRTARLPHPAKAGRMTAVRFAGAEELVAGTESGATMAWRRTDGVWKPAWFRNAAEAPVVHITPLGTLHADATIATETRTRRVANATFLVAAPSCLVAQTPAELVALTPALEVVWRWPTPPRTSCAVTDTACYAIHPNGAVHTRELTANGQPRLLCRLDGHDAANIISVAILAHQRAAVSLTKSDLLVHSLDTGLLLERTPAPPHATEVHPSGEWVFAPPDVHAVKFDRRAALLAPRPASAALATECFAAGLDGPAASALAAALNSKDAAAAAAVVPPDRPEALSAAAAAHATALLNRGGAGTNAELDTALADIVRRLPSDAAAVQMYDAFPATPPPPPHPPPPARSSVDDARAILAAAKKPWRLRAAIVAKAAQVPAEAWDVHGTRANAPALGEHDAAALAAAALAQQGVPSPTEQASSVFGALEASPLCPPPVEAVALALRDDAPDVLPAYVAGVLQADPKPWGSARALLRVLGATDGDVQTSVSVALCSIVLGDDPAEVVGGMLSRNARLWCAVPLLAKYLFTAPALVASQSRTAALAGVLAAVSKAASTQACEDPSAAADALERIAALVHASRLATSAPELSSCSRTGDARILRMACDVARLL